MATKSDGQLLELLLTGAPDKAIAVKLGISERTVQRRVGRLMGEVGAENRMQLGRYAAALDEAEAEAESGRECVVRIGVWVRTQCRMYATNSSGAPSQESAYVLSSQCCLAGKLATHVALQRVPGGLIRVHT